MKNDSLRLAKFLADSGIASRRKAEDIILAGKVKVNDKIIKTLPAIINPDKDKVEVNNKLISASQKVYYLLNKPVGYICSVSDPHNAKNVISLIPKDARVYPVGRLDKDSQGLLLLTNDGELTYQLTHPKFKIDKKYLVKVDKPITKEILNRLKQGIKLDEGLAKADEVKQQNKQELIIIIHQGWKRQIRRMLEKLGYQVITLTRLAEGKLTLNKLPVGKYKEITKKDII